MAAIFVLVFFVVSVLGIGLAIVVSAIGRPVSRQRVERLARRQALLITPGNGNTVIRYLAVTRRWRVLGLTTGILLSAIWSVRDGRLNLDLLAAFAGWFVGAVIAEFRIATAEPGVRREASLEPRLLRDQLRPAARVMPLVMLAVVAGLGLALGIAAAAGRSVPGGEVLTALVLAIGALGVPVLVGRHVLSRARPLGLASDLRAADGALRDRSLHVLAGCAVALLAYPAVLLMGAAAHAFPAADPGFSLAVVVLDIGAPLCGWVVARSPRPATVRAALVVPAP